MPFRIHCRRLRQTSKANPATDDLRRRVGSHRTERAEAAMVVGLKVARCRWTGLLCVLLLSACEKQPASPARVTVPNGPFVLSVFPAATTAYEFSRGVDGPADDDTK